MFLWASLGDDVDAALVAQKMLELGHQLAPGSAFSDGSSVPNSYIRINIAETFESSMLPTLGKVLGRTRKPR